VSKFVKIASMSLFALLAAASLAFGQEGAAPSAVSFSGSFGAGLVVVGAAYGIGKLASSAMEGMARQPEAAGSIQVGMIIAAALIEGFTFFALYICMTGV